MAKQYATVDIYENQAGSRRSKRISQRKEYLNNHLTEAKAL